KRLAKLFQQTTGANLVVEPQDWPIESRLIAAIAAGTQPEIVCSMGTCCVPLYMQGALMSLGYSVYKAMKTTPNEVFFTDAVQSYSWQDEIYGVPVEAGGVGNMVGVPVDEVRRLGLEEKYPPTDGRIWFRDYPELFELAGALQIVENGEVIRWGLTSMGSEPLSYLGILRSLLAERGTDWWDPANARFNVDTEEGVQAMRWLVEAPVKLGIETALDDASWVLALLGTAALAHVYSPELLWSIWDSLGFNYELTGVPMCVPNKLPLSCSEAGWGFVAPRDSMNPDVAIEFLKMMLTEEGQAEYNKVYGGYPYIAWKGLVDKFAHWANPDPNSKAVRFAKVYQREIRPLARYYGEALGYYDKAEMIIAQVCREVRQQKMTAGEACRVAQQRLEAQYKEWKEDMQGRI
ncbi:MAG: extracellular solute-binding protein, partial [Anaerolineae bacterium]|nr:extracellular solute-binding protein [Anaerolineae bacterium]